jgi:hypothetical protein
MVARSYSFSYRRRLSARLEVGGKEGRVVATAGTITSQRGAN